MHSPHLRRINESDDRVHDWLNKLYYAIPPEQCVCITDLYGVLPDHALPAMLTELVQQGRIIETVKGYKRGYK